MKKSQIWLGTAVVLWCLVLFLVQHPMVDLLSTISMWALLLSIAYTIGRYYFLSFRVWKNDFHQLSKQEKSLELWRLFFMTAGVVLLLLFLFFYIRQNPS